MKLTLQASSQRESGLQSYFSGITFLFTFTLDTDTGPQLFEIGIFLSDVVKCEKHAHFQKISYNEFPKIPFDGNI